MFARRAIPPDLRTDEDVIAYARRFSREWRVTAWLYLGRRERLALRNVKITRHRPFTAANFREADFGVTIR